jgi:hypothetical protein
VQAYNASVPLLRLVFLPDDVISVDGLWSTYCGRFRVWTDFEDVMPSDISRHAVLRLVSSSRSLPCYRAQKVDSDLPWLLSKTIRLIGFAQSGRYPPQYLMSTTRLSEHLANPSNLQSKNPKMKILQSLHAVQWVSVPGLPPKALQQIL